MDYKKTLELISDKYYAYIYHPIRNMYYAIRNSLMKLFRGYSDPECFDFFSHCAKYALPRLKAYRANLHGCPGDLCPPSNPDNEWEVDANVGMKAWEEILDKIIFALNECAYHTAEDEIYKKYPYKVTIKAKESRKIYTVYETEVDNRANWDKALEERKRLAERVQEGCELFGKYFQSLWD